MGGGSAFLPDEPAPAAPAKPAPAKAPRAHGPRKPATSAAASRPKPEAPAAQVAAPSPTPRAPAPVPAPVPTGPRPTVVDASDLVLGRAASLIARRLLQGESIVVVNAEKSVVTGRRETVIEIYRANRARGSVRSGPHFPRYPDRIFRRTVRGMLPHLKTRGRQALDRLEVHIGTPAPYEAGPQVTLEDARARPTLRRPTTLEEISRLLGARL
jgi:large subunit ribosomal protein L13